MERIIEMAPATFNQLATVRVGQLLAEHLPGLAGLVRVAGHLADPGLARGAWHYGVRLSDDGGRVLVDLPAALVRSRKLAAGQWVLLTGIVRVRAGQLGTLELRLEVSDVETAQTADVARRVPATASGRMTPEAVSGLPNVRRPFPVVDGRPLQLVLIQSSSLQAQVAQDCLAEIDKLGKLVSVQQVPINMLDAAAIANAIEKARGDVLLLIRGGGDAADFEVFDDPRVVTALAEKDCYRVIGLGHSGNKTLLDAVVECSARTPAQAGLHVRESVERVIALWRERSQQHQAAPLAVRSTGTRWAVAVVGILVGIAAAYLSFKFR